MPTQFPFIDMHTHLFTGRYLPIHGIMRSFKVPNFLAKGLHRFAISITAASDFDANHDESQDDLFDAIMGRDADKLMQVTTGRVRTLIRNSQFPNERNPDEEMRLRESLGALDEFSVALGDVAEGDRPISSRILHDGPLAEGSVFSGELTAPDMLDSLLTRALAAAGKILSGTEFFHDAAHIHLDDGYDEGTDHGLRAVGLNELEIKGLRQVLLFISALAMSERNRFRFLEKDFDKGKADDGFDATYYVGVLMDMEEAYCEIYGRSLKRPHFDFKTQMWRMNALAKETDGRLFSYGAVDPFRSADWKCYVEYGRNNGAEGFKIYCPLGYRPIDDRSYTTPVSPHADEDYKKYAAAPAPSPHAQNAIREILPYFAKNNIRMFTHCTPIGFQTKEGYGVFGDPELWRRAMNRYNARDLWLFLGHGGGATQVDWFGWASETDAGFDESFAYRAIQLVQDYDNVYMGLGYIMQMVDPKMRKAIVTRLKTELTKPKPEGAKYHFREKVCFGTDWSMLEMVGRTRSYLNAFYEFFEDEEVRHCAPAFFQGNALRFLGRD
ncbi:hypothetical protein [Ruegeria lacuscaerulensis]|uniref:hypothetical protein n=1 Tax=Ruegeria lacuscaerulensis TaxID=55218 RepID=UPI00147CE17C|nr:hypothetical protein [Ruegeria lacuscaerulensis]